MCGVTSAAEPQGVVEFEVWLRAGTGTSTKRPFVRGVFFALVGECRLCRAFWARSIVTVDLVDDKGCVLSSCLPGLDRLDQPGGLSTGSV